MVDERDHKLAVVTGGAGGGIGRGISTVLAREGWHVLIVDVDEAAAAGLVDALEQEGLKVRAQIADLTADATPDSIIEACLNWGGRLDGLVHNAGVSVIKPAADITDAEYDRLTAVNLRAMFRVSRAAVEPLGRRGGGIVNISSVHALATAEGYSVYSADQGRRRGVDPRPGGGPGIERHPGQLRPARSRRQPADTDAAGRYHR